MNRSCTVDLSPDRTAPAFARALVRGLLEQWGVADEAAVDAACVVVTELVVNAVEHAATGDAVTVAVEDDGVLRLWVADGAAAVPEQRPPSSDLDDGGRGLALVDALAARWGVEAWHGGKRVVVELAWDREPAS